LYAEVFDGVGALSKLSDFASGFGADFYGLPRNDGTITLVREATPVPREYPFGEDTLVPVCAGETVAWKVQTA
jgi:dihydroorotase